MHALAPRSAQESLSALPLIVDQTFRTRLGTFMQRACHLPSTLGLLAGRPNVGVLMSLCEENYRLLSRLVPALREVSGHFVSHRPGVIDLHLEIEQQARYTTQLRLTHLFGVADQERARPDPDARLRVYHDARQVEVLDLVQSVLPLRTDYAHPALADKWQANLFLGKWLRFCLRQGHRLGCPVSLVRSSPGLLPTTTCT